MRAAAVALLVAAVLVAAAAGRADPVNEIAPTSVCPNKGKLLLCLHNYARKVNGLPPLTASTKLYTAAKLKAQRMVACGQFTHTPCGDPAFLVLEQAGYTFTAAGENAALGYTGQRAAMKAWLESPGHRANVLSPFLKQYGSNAAYKLGGGRLWVVDLATP